MPTLHIFTTTSLHAINSDEVGKIRSTHTGTEKDLEVLNEVKQVKSKKGVNAASLTDLITYARLRLKSKVLFILK